MSSQIKLLFKGNDIPDLSCFPVWQDLKALEMYCQNLWKSGKKGNEFHTLFYAYLCPNSTHRG